jgi:hypothetical protein
MGRSSVGVALAGVVLAFGYALAVAQPAPSLSGHPIDEAYRSEFAKCDASDIFDGVHFPIRRPNGKILWYGCSTDPSRFARFEAIDATSSAPAAVVIESKLGHDEDGSFAPCHHQGGVTDQCTTSLMLKSTTQHPCLVAHASASACVPVDADTVPYVVIPAAAPRGIEAHAFTRLSRVGVGDYGVVVIAGKVVPVIVGDEGPAYKIGEGSTALLRAISSDGSVHTYGAHVTFVLFPGSSDPSSLGALRRHRRLSLRRRLVVGGSAVAAARFGIMLRRRIR